MSFPDLDHFCAHAEELTRDLADQKGFRQHLMAELAHTAEKVEDASATLHFLEFRKERLQWAVSFLEAR